MILNEGNNALNVSMTPTPPPTASLSGMVVDAQTSAPIEGVLVQVGGFSTYTSAAGVYSLTGIPPGNYVVQFSKQGYETLVL